MIVDLPLNRGPGAAPAFRRVEIPDPAGCVYLGPDTGVDLPCPCGRTADAYRCEKRGLATLALPVPGVPCCLGCPLRTLPDATVSQS